MAPKLTIIGAGSAVFSLRLLIDVCLTPALHGGSVCLMDVNEDRLKSIHRLFERYSDETGANITTTATTDRREALQGADYVINTALAAGWKRSVDGWEIAKRHGYRYGGSLHIMHDEPFWSNFYQFQFFESVVQDVLEICPEAWYLQVANPVLAAGTYLGRKYPELKMVGLCHGFSGVFKIADVLGLDRERLQFEIPGVNHTVFVTNLYHDGQPVMPLFDRWLETEGPEYWKTCPPGDGLGPIAVDLYRRFGVFPIGDTCTSGGGSWPWWYHTDAATEEKWHDNPQAWWDEYLAKGLDGVDKIHQTAMNPEVRVTDVYPMKPSGEVMVPLIEALHTGVPKIITVNIMNDGQLVPGVPEDFAVEVPALVSRRGIQGIQTTRLPEEVIAWILRDRVATVTTELEAFETRSRDRLIDLILMDPWTRSLDQGNALLDDLLALPILSEVREYYR